MSSSSWLFLAWVSVSSGPPSLGEQNTSKFQKKREEAKKLEKRKLRLGLIGLVLTLSLMPGCKTLSTERIKPHYSKTFLEEVKKDYKTCGPFSKTALVDWLVMIE